MLFSFNSHMYIHMHHGEQMLRGDLLDLLDRFEAWEKAKAKEAKADDADANDDDADASDANDDDDSSAHDNGHVSDKTGLWVPRKALKKAEGEK